jgi:hypothetical protein
MKARPAPAPRPLRSRSAYRWRSGLATALAALLPLAASASASASALSAEAASAVLSGPGVCDGVAGCRVKARADVNGDGSPDVIGIAKRGKNGAPQGKVVVRVKTGPRTIVSTAARTEYWYGPPWQGTAALDGRGGNEIVVGLTVGAHGQSYRALSWRRGELVTLDAPGRGKFWYIDSAVWISAGWLQRSGDPVGTIRRRVAVRTGDSAKSPFEGKVTTFRWAPDGWERLGTRTVYPLSDKRAFRWGGFHVPGLLRW